jgi:aldehyde:ferredoxin oxidoreductase
MAQESTGYAGKVLRIDLTTGKVSSEDTLAKYKDYIGGSGLAYKVIWDEVPAGTKPLDPENRLIFGVGPLSGSGSPCSGRVIIGGLSPTAFNEGVAVGHMGGEWGPELKFAGWDSIIIQGKANSPVWIYINDDKVELRDAKRLWGNGIFETTALISNEVGADAHVAAIGQAGENLLKLSCVMCDRSHSAGMFGSVMGSKNLKAIAVKGTKAVRIAADKKAWKDLVYEYLTLMGANNQAVVPSYPQPWAEYSDPLVRWNAGPGRFWGAASPPVETGYCTADDLNKMGLRTHKGIHDFGVEMGIKHTVKIGGCFGCPIRCHSSMDIPQLEQYGVSRYQTNTCVGFSHGRGWYELLTTAKFLQGEPHIQCSAMGSALADDYGWWNDYSQTPRDFSYMVESGKLKELIPAKEYDSYDWKARTAKDPGFLISLFKNIVYKEGEIGNAFGLGGLALEKKWKDIAEFHKTRFDSQCFKFGQSKHHAAEDFGQVGMLINFMYNRDPQTHAHINFSANGLPLALRKEIGAEIFGTPDAVENRSDHKPMNKGKAVYAKLSVYYKELHDSLTMCSWTQPVWSSPRKDLKYRGDIEMEAKLFSAVTGIKKTRADLENDAARIFTLQRALDIKFTGVKDQRKTHDVANDWVFDYPKDAKPFTPGNYKMERADAEIAKDMLYEELGWDKDTGAPTKATLDKLGLGYVADDFGKKGLLV